MKNSILTIDPGTRYWGVSVFHGVEIITCMVKNLSAKDSARNRLLEVRRLFTNLCRAYAPNILVIEKPYDFWEDQSKHLEGIIREIKHLARMEHIKVSEFSPKAIRKAVCDNEKASKEHIATAICHFYPELKMCLIQNFEGKYWEHMSDSIGLGICYLKHHS